MRDYQVIKLTNDEMDACSTALHVLIGLGFLSEERYKLILGVIAKLEAEDDD